MKQSIEFCKTYQLQIDAEIDRKYHEAVYLLQDYKGCIVRITPEAGKPFYGVVDTYPVSVYNGILRLCLLNYQAKKGLVEKRKRVVPVADIFKIEIIGKYTVDGIQLKA
jgi:hypothetical protein